MEWRVAAAEPIISPDKIEGWAIIHVSQVGRKADLVAIRVEGRSMEPLIPAGSMVAIDREDREIPKDRKLARKRIYKPNNRR